MTWLLISFRYLSNDVALWLPLITSLRWFLLIEHIPGGINYHFLLFFFVFVLHIDFLLGASRETWMGHCCYSWTELEIANRES